MTLWERVTMLIKADVNALIEKAENPEAVLKQLLLDMQNQYIQVKTHVAIAAAHQHLLERKQKENLEAQNEWLSKAELAVRKGDEKLAERDKQRFGDEAMQKDLSSITHIAKGKHIPPFLILHVADHLDTTGQSQRLLQVLKAAGIPANTYAAEGKNHMTLNDDLGTPDDKPTKALFEFLDGVLKK